MVSMFIYPLQENYRHYVEFMAKLYAEGLLDAEVFTQTNEQYVAKMQEMIVGFTPNNHYGTIGLENYLKTVNCKPLTSEYNDTPMHPGNQPEVPTYGMCITNKATEEEAIAAIKLLDYLYSEEGSFLTKCGPEYGAWGIWLMEVISARKTRMAVIPMNWLPGKNMATIMLASSQTIGLDVYSVLLFQRA